jgi:hypothetical protein
MMSGLEEDKPLPDSQPPQLWDQWEVSELNIAMTRASHLMVMKTHRHPGATSRSVSIGLLHGET